jgi:hypothetical protein
VSGAFAQIAALFSRRRPPEAEEAIEEPEPRPSSDEDMVEFMAALPEGARLDYDSAASILLS